MSIEKKLDRIIELLEMLVEKEKKDKNIEKKDVSKEDNSKELVSFLEKRGIKVKTIKKDDNEKILDQLATFIGDNYENIKEFLKNLKNSGNKKTPFVMYLKKYPSRKISDITQLANMLYKVAFLDEFDYKRSPYYVLNAKLNPIPKAINFINGGWLERYVRLCAINVAESLGLDVSYIQNIQIMLPSGHDFELDILMKIDKNIFWFEAKTGDYQRYVKKYSDVSKILGLSKEFSYMVLTDMTKEGAKVLTDLFNMSVVSINDFKEEFENRLKSIN